MARSKRDARSVAILRRQQTAAPGTDDATVKQRELLAKLDPKLPLGSLTKAEASTLIDMYLKRK